MTKQCIFLLSLHLSDNLLALKEAENPRFKYVMDFFNINNDDLAAVGRSYELIERMPEKDP